MRHLAMVVLAACGGGVAKDQLVAALEDAICDHRVECLEVADKPSCLASLDYDDSEVKTILADIDAGSIDYDDDAAADCVDQQRHQGCMFGGFHRTKTRCFDMFRGKVGNGGACFIAEQCAGQAVCQHTDPMCDPRHACCPGTCVALVPLGGDCAAMACAEGAYCNVQSMCVPYLAEGGACDRLASCVNPLFCDVSGSGSLGTCARTIESDGACDPNALFSCGDIRDYCDTTTHVCTRAAPVGDPCGTGKPPCVLYATCTNGSCVANPGAGEACTGNDCIGDLACTSNACALPAAGTACR